MARRRIGAGACRRIAAQPSLDEALALLAESAYAQQLAAGTTLGEAQRATREAVLWQLRVLAGWQPGRGTGLVRTAAGAFERDNVVALAHRLEGGPDVPPFELGSLATAWPRLQGATSTDELPGALRRSRWGDVGTGGTSTLSDVLTVVWLRRLAAVAPEAAPWAVAASSLAVARILLVDHREPSARLRQLVLPVLGRTWVGAESLGALRDTLPVAGRRALAGIDTVEDLWRAEAAVRAKVEADGFALLRGPRAGRGVVLGAMAVLAIDAWRVRAALAAAAVGAGSSEVLDAMA